MPDPDVPENDGGIQICLGMYLTGEEEGTTKVTPKPSARVVDDVSEMPFGLAPDPYIGDDWGGSKT